MTGDARCTKCYQPLEGDAKFCAKCGTPVQPVTDLRDAPPSRPAVSECPSCHHENPLTARFCERCGTQLRGIGPGGSALEPSHEQTSQGRYTDEPEDPWATGPGYQGSADPRRVCPRCSTFRNPGDTACVECGLPFGDPATATGVPAAVAALGDPAGFWIRFTAAIVDGLIILGIGAVIWPVLFGEAFWFTDTVVLDDGTEAEYPTVRSWITVMQLLYHTLFIALFGATPGKRLFNIQVYDARGRRGIGFIQAAIRAVATILSTFTLFIGYLMAAFRRDKRALHDLVAGTYPTIRRR